MTNPVETESSEISSSLLDLHIAEQIEYYFGEFNLPKDKFLKHEITKDDGWVSVSTLLRFNRLAALTKDVDVIMSALKKNPSTLIQVDDEGKRVRRNPEREVPEHDETWRSTVAERSIYVKGFPADSTTMDDILKFMSTFGKIDNVWKRAYHDKALKQWKFKGSIFVAFPTKEDAEKFMAIGSVKYAGNELIRKWQNDYVEEKKNERLRQKQEAKEMKNQLLKEQQEEFKKDQKKLPRGALIALSGLKKEIGFIELKKTAFKFGWDVAFVDYTEGESNAYVRLQAENSAKDALAKLTDSSFTIKDITIKAALVEGDEETTLLEKMEADKTARVMQQFDKFKGKKGKGRKNKFGKHGKSVDCGGDKNNKTSEEGLNGHKMEVSSTEPEVSTSEGALKRKGGDDADEDAAKKSKSDEK